MSYSVLSRTTKLGIAAESSTADYAAPTFTVTFERPGTRYQSAIVQLYDRTVRGTDTDTQAIAQGPYWSDWSISTLGYADWAGWLFRAMVGPDQFTAGTVTTFAGPSVIAAKAISLDAAPPSNSVLMLGTGSSQEYAQCGTPTGSGPYLVPITMPSAGLRFAHPAGDSAQSQASHLFQQDRTYSTVWPTYSLTSDDGVDQLGWPGCTLGRLRFRLRDTGLLALTSSWNGWPPVAASTFSEDQGTAQPPAGWAWSVVTAGGPSTRGKALDLTLNRPLQITPTLCGQQAPYCIGPGPMRASGSYSAIYDTPSDLNLYREAIQQPAVWSVTQPVLQGGCSIAITLSLSGWTAGTVSLDDSYIEAAYSLTGITNTMDSAQGGVSSVELLNFWPAAYA